VQRLHKRQSPYRAVFGALTALAGAEADAEALASLMQEPDDDPGDFETLDRLWAETAVTFGPSDVGCPEGGRPGPRHERRPRRPSRRRAAAA
jgi:nitrate reductase delta subunit